MKKALLKSLGLEYFVGNEPSPFEGLPVFTQREIDIIKRSRDTITEGLLRQIFVTKATVGGTLEDISLKLAEEAEFNQSPREDIGYVPPKKAESPRELAARYAEEIKAKLKNSGAKTRKEKEDGQPSLF